MTDRPFPPSPRRLALARQAGLVAASPILVGGFACTALAVVLAFGVGRAARGLAGAITAACNGRATLGAGHDTVLAVLALVTPLVGAAAVTALLAHVAQTRGLWLPRRRITGAPSLDRGAAVRARSAAFDLVATAVIGALGFGWLWLAAPRVAALVQLSPREMLAATITLGVSLVAVVATAWVALGIIDTLLRHLALARALAMTSVEKRDDDRLAAADPRWARQRALAAAERPSTVPSIETATVVLVGDELAIAIAWDPTRRPIPSRLAIGRRARAAQLVGLARRYRIAIHRDVELATGLADVEGPIPQLHWGRLAEIIAALRR